MPLNIRFPLACMFCYWLDESNAPADWAAENAVRVVIHNIPSMWD